MSGSLRRLETLQFGDLSRMAMRRLANPVRRRRSRPGKIPGHQQPASPRTSSPPGTTYPRPPNPVLHLTQLSPELEPCHNPPPAPPPAPPRREAGDELKPP